MASDSTDKLKILEEKIKGLDNKNADGNLMIKVSKRDTAVPHGMYRPQIVCTLVGGAVSHVANPELWLPRLMGGGSFALGVFVPEASSVALVDGIEITLTGIEERRFPDLDATDDPAWKGPKTIIYPTKSAKQGTPTTFASPPSTLPNTNTAPQSHVSGMGGGSGATSQETAEMRRLIEEHRAYALNLQQQLEAERRQREEDRHKREMEILRAQQQAENERQRQDMEKVREELKAIKNAPPPAPATPAPTFMEMLKEALPVAAPLITAWMAASAEKERRAEERLNKTLEAIAAKPAIDPMIKEMLDQKAASELPLATYMQQSAASTAALIGQMANMAKDMIEMSSGPEESMAVKAIREVGNVVQGIASSVSAPAPKPPRRLPRVEGQQAAPAAPQQPAAMHGLDGAPPTGVLAKLKAMLIAKEDPDKVAAETLRVYETPEFQRALEGVGGNPEALFGHLLGEEWIRANLEYANSFGTAFAKHVQSAQAAGDPEEGPEEEAA